MYKGNKHGTLKPTVLRCAARSLSSKLPAWYSAKPTHRALQVALRRYMLPICPELKTSLKTDHLDLGGGLGIPSIRGSLVNTLA